MSFGPERSIPQGYPRGITRNALQTGYLFADSQKGGSHEMKEGKRQRGTREERTNFQKQTREGEGREPEWINTRADGRGECCEPWRVSATADGRGEWRVLWCVSATTDGRGEQRVPWHVGATTDRGGEQCEPWHAGATADRRRERG
ncbi:hypothetical protein NDU88_005421 [Pleurodeles waltl]|uniref:Uncharacterized protein n=1 Tax=Pleurodeles waltl TaxID=8319 RepID=A0AAV7WUQ9_PLEWA|nr:hypothetical protein NDU88_005421 [Pleurodeles waltl]